ncbi:flavin oxidoreductase [Prosthecomicrobium hirschii]|jgi:flavin reductase (DIM6/NTAB) family NADH-FMN oxidoreductase RutF|uniref:flavin reductase family protein n=1 Tax=Prosthecodimorpha hirschii TaxID=665126 RepID=UPI0011273EB7|nr:flavin reductase family protein [Prosthecomicrobium hirschii]TPQ49536.1 flavin oxidoreductase [Prosthecomicrobium hirschii]
MTALPRVAGRTSGSARFKLGMRSLVGGVTVIGAHGTDGHPVGLTATAVSSLSADPPSLLVCVNRQSTIAAALVAGAAFSVNVLTEAQTDVAQAFGGQRPVRGTSRFAFGNWLRSADSEVPLLHGCRVAFECVVADLHDWATHHIVIGTVADIHFFDAEAGPLAYADGEYKVIRPLTPGT